MKLSPLTFVLLICGTQGTFIDPNFANDILFFCTNTYEREFVQTYVQDSELEIKLNMSLPFAMVIHGWLDSTNSLLFEIDHMGWPLAVCQQWVNFVNTNCCAVNWHKFAFKDFLIASQFGTRITAEYTTAFIRPIIELGMSPDDISIAGHSLGGHIAGFTGRNLQTFGYKIHYIFGLDPGGPGFTQPFIFEPGAIFTPLVTVPYEAELNRNDAIFVQVLHTSEWTWGSAELFGNADYIVNNGKVQPRCLKDLIDSPENEQLGTIFACSHYRAVQIFYYSLNPEYAFVGTYCEYEGFYGLLNNLTNVCDNTIHDKYGVYTANIEGDFQVATTGTPPFCEGCMTMD